MPFDMITYAAAKKYTDSSLQNIGNKSAFDIAKENGFDGTVDEWLESLKGENGITPSIGENGNWFIGDTDTGVAADGSYELDERVQNALDTNGMGWANKGEIIDLATVNLEIHVAEDGSKSGSSNQFGSTQGRSLFEEDEYYILEFTYNYDNCTDENYFDVSNGDTKSFLFKYKNGEKLSFVIAGDEEDGTDLNTTFTGTGMLCCGQYGSLKNDGENVPQLDLTLTSRVYKADISKIDKKYIPIEDIFKYYTEDHELETAIIEAPTSSVLLSANQDTGITSMVEASSEYGSLLLLATDNEQNSAEINLASSDGSIEIGASGNVSVSTDGQFLYNNEEVATKDYRIDTALETHGLGYMTKGDSRKTYKPLELNSSKNIDFQRVYSLGRDTEFINITVFPKVKNVDGTTRDIGPYEVFIKTSDGILYEDSPVYYYWTLVDYELGFMIDTHFGGESEEIKYYEKEIFSFEEEVFKLYFIYNYELNCGSFFIGYADYDNDGSNYLTSSSELLIDIEAVSYNNVSKINPIYLPEVDDYNSITNSAIDTLFDYADNETDDDLGL